MNDPKIEPTQSVAVMTPHQGPPVGFAKPQAFSMTPTTLTEAREYAMILAKSGMVPKDYANEPEKVLVAVQMGSEVGLKPLQALQNIAVINGRPTIWGDALVALVRASGVCGYINETFEGEAGTDSYTAVCETLRKGEAVPQVRRFSVTDAKRAQLWGKAGPWTNTPQRMLQVRARAFALRDVYADLLKGLAVTEEAMDIPVTDYRQVEPSAAPRPSLVERIQGGGQSTVTDATVVEKPAYDVAAVEKKVLEAVDMKALIALGESCQMAPPEHKGRLRTAYTTRKGQLDAAAKVKAADAPPAIEGEVLDREPGQDG